MYNDLETLIGKKVLSVSKTTDNTYVKFNTSGGDVIYHTYGDCCSNSWIEHFEGINSLVGATITSINLVAGERREDAEYEVLQIYFYKFNTDKGSAQIDMRNSSNGYYGGSLELCTDENRWNYDKDELKTSTFNLILGDF